MVVNFYDNTPSTCGLVLMQLISTKNILSNKQNAILLNLIALLRMCHCFYDQREPSCRRSMEDAMFFNNQ